jgi:hypothetical protein
MEQIGSELEGLVVLDFCAFMAGAFCTRLLARWGANVIKIESPEGDHLRAMRPIRDGQRAWDLVVTDTDPTFALPDVSRGLIAGAGGLVCRPRRTPIKRTPKLALFGDPIDAAAAIEWGVVNVVADTGKALAASIRLAGRVAADAPVVVRQSQRIIDTAAHGGSEWSPTGMTTTSGANRQASRLVFPDDQRCGGPACLHGKAAAGLDGR